jgi:tetratricopeptide (TPR) repeat protein
MAFVPGLIACLVLVRLPAYAVGDDTGSTGSVTITKHANNAAKAFAQQDYATAKAEYREAISLSPTTMEFYIGLYDVCAQTHEWDQVAFALERMFDLDPSKKKQLGAQYGEALYHLKRYDEAIPVLKQALKDADLPQPKLSLAIPTPPPEPQAKPAPPQTVASADTTGGTVGGQPVQIAVGTNSAAATAPLMNKEPAAPLNVNEGQLGTFSKSFENAAHSECIVLAEYRGYEKSGDITFYHPPLANYHINKILKGPPLNKELPIRYEFHDRSACTAPKGWKFGPDKMPEIGSQWIIFIQNAVPRDRMFDTFQGAYGRQPASEDNLNQIYALLEAHSNR